MTPSDARFDEQWALHNEAQTGGIVDADIDAPEAWDVITGTGATIVAVIDTGVDYRHPDLAANIWVNVDEIPGDGIDNDNNGYVDDVHGYDFFNEDGDPLDDHNHGTHVAGTIGAVGNDGIGIAGVNWNTQIMALKFLGADGSGTTSDAIEALFATPSITVPTFPTIAGAAIPIHKLCTMLSAMLVTRITSSLLPLAMGIGLVSASTTTPSRFIPPVLTWTTSWRWLRPMTGMPRPFLPTTG